MTTDELLLALCKYDAIIVRCIDGELVVEQMRGAESFPGRDLRECLVKLSRFRVDLIRKAIESNRRYISEYEANVASLQGSLRALEQAIDGIQGDAT